MSQQPTSPQYTSSTPPEPLPLPKFTFICGPRNETGRSELRDALLSRDPDMMRLDLEEPLRIATQDILFGGFDPMRDLDPEEMTSLGCKVSEFMSALERMMREEYLKPALGMLLWKSFHEMGHATVFDRFITSDCHRIEDADYVASQTAKSQVLCIQLGLLGASTLCQNIWLPQETLGERLAQLRIELGKPR